MVSTMLTVGHQIVILFILIAIGIICKKVGFLNETVVKGMNNIVLYFVTPCLMMQSFQRDKNPSLMKGLLVATIAAFASHFIAILLAHLIIHDKDRANELIMRFAVIFGNCGFMTLPIQQAILGADGVFYGAMFIAVFNVILWTYGLKTMSAGEEKITVRKLIVNPGIIGMLLGLILFLTQFRFPEVIEAPIDYIAGLNVPVPMFIIGYYLGNLKFKDLTQNKKQYLAIALRLLGVPLLTMAVMLPFKVDPTVFVAVSIGSCSPVAAKAVMFATKYDKNPELGSEMVSVSTLFSLITMPVMISLSEVLAKL